MRLRECKLLIALRSNELIGFTGNVFIKTPIQEFIVESILILKGYSKRIEA